MMILGLVFAYFFAGIPVGLLVGRMYGIADIRLHGSGNIGATNILRVIGWKAGLAVWVIDLLKGLIPVLVARHLLGLEGWGVGLAGLAAGVYASTDEIASYWQSERVFTPAMDEIEREKRLSGWRRAVERAKRWETPE